MVEENKISSMIQNPYIIGKDESIYISNVLQNFPYFQTAHILYSKSLQNAKSIRFKSQLKKTAIYSGDRNLLFNIIRQQKDSNISNIQTYRYIFFKHRSRQKKVWRTWRQRLQALGMLFWFLIPAIQFICLVLLSLARQSETSRFFQIKSI